MSAPDLYRLPQADRPTAAGIYLGAVATVVRVVGLAIWAATQYAAFRLRFHPALGAPLLVVPLSYRGLLGPAAILAGALGAGCAADARWRRAALVLFAAAAVLLALDVGPLYAPLDFFFWWWRFGSAPWTAPIWRVGTWLVLVPGHF